MKLNEIVKILENVAPLSLQEDWDNSGFQIKLHNDNDEINTIYVCLEITFDSLQDAINNNADLIITHHPLLFSSINSINTDYYSHKYIELLIKNNISVYSSHTPFDKCNGGNNDYFGKVLGFTNVYKTNLEDDGYLRYADFNNEISLNDLVHLISMKFNINRNFFNYAGPFDLKIKRVSWVTGSGADYIIYAKDIDSDLFITGDLSYHKARDSREINMPTLAIGHYASENIFIENISRLYSLNNCPDLKVISSNININPYEVL